MDVKEVVDHVASLCGTTARHFEPGTRAGILKRERMAKLSKEVKKAKAEGKYRKVLIDPGTGLTEEIVRGKPGGKLD